MIGNLRTPAGIDVRGRIQASGVTAKTRVTGAGSRRRSAVVPFIIRFALLIHPAAGLIEAGPAGSVDILIESR